MAVIPALIDSVGIAVVVLLAVGGLFYTVGGILYATRWPDPWPTTFGHHEFFHACTVIAALVHYIAVWLVLFSLARIRSRQLRPFSDAFFLLDHIAALAPRQSRTRAAGCGHSHRSLRSLAHDNCDPPCPVSYRALAAARVRTTSRVASQSMHLSVTDWP